MRKHHPKNERIKRQYFVWLEDARQLSAHSIGQKASAIALFEQSTNYRDFATFHIEQARAFKRRQAESINEVTKKPLAKATIKARLDTLKAFFHWLADQPGYCSKVKHSDAEYFNMSAHDVSIATAKRPKRWPELEQVHTVINGMKAETPYEKRTRAIIAFALLTGARDDAIASCSISHVDLKERVVFQDARDVRTKFRKTFSTWFFPVEGRAEEIVAEWVEYLQTEWNFGASDPLFPPTLKGLDEHGKLGPKGFRRQHWKNADAIRKAFRDAFTSVGLPCFKPHSIRDTLTQLGLKICKTAEEFKAWSQNLGHDDVLTTFKAYGPVSSQRQAEIILGLRADRRGNNDTFALADLEAFVANVKAQGKAA